jgi:hypothetical protein
MKTKLWKILLFHLFDLVMVNAQIFHNKSSTKNMSLEIFYEKVTEGRFLASDRTEIQVQDQTSSPACRLVVRDHSIYSIPAKHAKLVEKYQLSFLVSAEKDMPDTEICEDVLKCTAENAM